MHEMMHTLGFIHEHSRKDRDAFISVVWENIKRGMYECIKIFKSLNLEICIKLDLIAQ